MVTPEIINYVFWGLFGFIMFTVLLGGISGARKGLLKTAIKTGLKVLLVVVFVFTAPYLANALGTIPLIPQDGEKVTLQMFIADYITSTGLVSPMNGLSLYETAIAISNSVLSYAVFFLLMIATQLFIGLCTSIIYHGIFRWFAPIETADEKRERKENAKQAKMTEGILDSDGEVIEEGKGRKKLPKLGFFGFLLGLAQQFVFVLTTFAPITSICAIALNNREAIDVAMDAAGVTAEDKDLFNSYIDEADKSYFFSIPYYKEYSEFIMSHAGSVSLQGGSVSLQDLTSALLDVAVPLFKDGKITYSQATGQVNINFSLLLTVESVQGLIQSITENSSLMALIPPLVDVGLNTIANNGINVEKIDLTDIDWSSDLSCIKSIYAAVYSDFVVPFISPDGFSFTMDSFTIDIPSMTDEHIREIAEGIANLGKMESVSKNLPTVLANIGYLLQGQGIIAFPTDVDAYKNIDWASELSLLVENLFRILKISNVKLTSDFNAEALTKEIYATLSDEAKREQMKIAFIGSDEKRGILDSSLVSKLSIPELIRSSLSSVPALSPYLAAIDLDNAFEGMDIPGFKREVSTIFDIGSIIFDENSPLYIDNLQVVDLADSLTCSELVRLLDIAENSVLFNKLYPSVMRSVLLNTPLTDLDFLFGLTPYAFNYESESFLTDFKSILELLPDVWAMTELLNSGKAPDKIIAEVDVDTIQSVLSIIVNSDFLNADQKTGCTDEAQKNINLKVVLDNIFLNDAFVQLGLQAPSMTTLQKIQWNSSEGKKGEISALCDTIRALQKNASFFAGDSYDIKNIKDIDGFSELISTAMDSEVLSESFLAIINNSLNEYLEKMGLPFNLQKMRTQMWKEDADALGDIIYLIQDLDIDNLDFSKIDPHRLNALLTTISRTNLCLETTDVHDSVVDPFGYVLREILIKAGFFESLNISVPTIEEFSAYYYDQSWSETLKEEDFIREGEERIQKIFVTQKGTIKGLENLMSIFQEFGFEDIGNGAIPTGFVDAIYSKGEIFSDKVLVGLFSKVLSSQISQIDMGAEYRDFLDSIDFSYLLKCTEEEIYYDFNMFEKLYSYTTVKMDSGKTLLTEILSNIFDLKGKQVILSDGTTANLIDIFFEIIDSFAESTLLNYSPDKTKLSPNKTLFKVFIQMNNLSDSVTLLQSGNSTAALNGMLLKITDLSEEFANLKSIVEHLQGIPIENLSFKDLAQEKAYLVLNTMNRSEIFHRFPIALIRDVLTSANIDALTVDPVTKVNRHPIRYEVHTGTSQRDYDFWTHEIDLICKLVFDAEDGLSSVLLNDGKDFGSLLISDLKNLHFLYYLGDMNILESNRSYLIYNILNNNVGAYALSDVLKPVSYPVPNENADVMRLEELLFRNPKLLGADGRMNKEKVYEDLDMTYSILDVIFKNLELLSSGEASSIDFDFAELSRSAVRLEGASIYRSDLASEIVAGAFTALVGNDKLSGTFGNLKDTDFYADNWNLVNPIEGDGLNGLVGLVKANVSTITIGSNDIPYYAKADLLPAFAALGRKNRTDALDQYYLGSEAYKTGNSYVGTHAYAVISGVERFIPFYIPVIKNTADPGDMYHALLDIVGDPSVLETKSFEEVLLAADIL